MSERMMLPPEEYVLDDRHATGRTPHAWSFGCNVEPRCVPAEPELKPEPELSPRADMLREAEELITGDRNNQYGPPTQDFSRTAALLNALGYRRLDASGVYCKILPSDVAIMISQVKVSRIMHSRGKRDSWVDLAGYAACGYECAVTEENSR